VAAPSSPPTERLLPPWLRSEKAALLAILALALVLRVIWVLQMRASPFFEDPALDQRFFVDAGRAIAKGGAAPAFRPPLYAWWLALSFELFGPGLLAPRLLQALAGTAAVWLVYQVAKLAYDRRVALVAAFLAATYWVLLYYDGELLRESLVNPANLLAVLATLWLSRRPSWSLAALAGAAWGLSALLRPQVLAVVPFLTAWLVLHSCIDWRKIVLFAVFSLVPLVPVALLDHAATGDALAFTAEGGQAFWSGNNPTADGVTSTSPGIRADFWGFYEDSRAQAELEERRSLLPSQVSRHYVRKTFAWFADEPGAAAKLLATKLWLFFTNWEFGNPEEPRFFAERFAPIVRWLPVGFGLVVAFAAFGLVARPRQGHPGAFPVWGFALVYGATVVLVLVSSRYRLPVIPFLLVLAAQGVVRLAEHASARRAWPFFGGLVLAGLVYTASVTFPVPRDASDANGLTWLGIAEDRAGHREKAVELFEEAIRLYPQGCEAHVDLGATLLKMQRVLEARDHLQRAVELCPDDVRALDALADLQLKIGRPDDARATAERSIRIAPHLARSRYNLGRAWIGLREPEKAAIALRAALERRPDYFNAAYALGMLSLDLGRTDDAIASLSRAVSSPEEKDDEFLLQAYGSLVETLARTGRRAEARETAARMVERFPQREEARRILAGL
jgi:Flp pilus assembly protein TadD